MNDTIIKISVKRLNLLSLSVRYLSEVKRLNLLSLSVRYLSDKLP